MPPDPGSTSGMPAGWDVAPAPLLAGARVDSAKRLTPGQRRAAAHATAGTGGRLAAPHLQRPGKTVIQ